MTHFITIIATIPNNPFLLSIFDLQNVIEDKTVVTPKDYVVLTSCFSMFS